MNDDGEPSGTAGRPLLNVIEHKGVGDVMVIVIRYFGGIKLGAGGLVRAYSGAAEAVMSILPVVQQVPRVVCRVLAPFAHEQRLRHWAMGQDAEVVDANYGQCVCLSLDLPEHHLDDLRRLAGALGCSVEMAET